MDLNTKMTISVTTSVAVTPDRKDTLTQVETALTALRDKLTGITHRPDNSDPGISDRRARCGTRSAGTFTYICLALKDHTGDHIAWGGGRNCHQWPQAEPLAAWEAELLALGSGTWVHGVMAAGNTDRYYVLCPACVDTVTLPPGYTLAPCPPQDGCKGICHECGTWVGGR